MSQPTNRTTVSTASRQEALALANAARKLTNLLPAVEDSSEALAAILRQHSSNLVLLHDELSDLAKRLELPQQQLVHNMQAVATAMDASSASEDNVKTQQHTCCVLCKALAFHMSIWKCRASTAVVAKCMLDVMKRIAEPLQGEMHLAMQQLMHTILQHMSSSPTCAADHNCLPLAQASLLKAISFAISSFPDLQQRSWDMGLLPCLLVALEKGQGGCRDGVLPLLATCLAAAVSAEAVQTVFHDDLSVPSLRQLSAAHEDDVGRIVQVAVNMPQEADVSGSDGKGMSQAVMIIGKAVLLMPFQQPLPQLWPLLLPHLATALNVRLFGYPHEETLATSMKYASRLQSRHAEGQSDAITLAIQAVVVVTIRVMAEDTSVRAVKLTPQNTAFLGLVSRLLLDCVEQHYNHHLGLDSSVMHWLLGPDKSSSGSEASTGEEDVRDICWAALCAGMRLSDEQCQHLRLMLTAWYLVEVWLGEAGVFGERLQIVKDWLMSNGEDYPSLMRLLHMLESDLHPQSASQASADSRDAAVTSAVQHTGSVNAAATSALITTMQMSSGRAISSTDTSLEGAQAIGAAVPPLAALPAAVLPPVAPPLAAPPPAVLPSVAPPLAVPPVAALPLAAPPLAAAVLPPVAPPLAATPVAALPLAAPPLPAPPQEQPANPTLDTVDGITTAMMRPEQPADVPGPSKALPDVELAAQCERESQARSSTGIGMSQPAVIIEQLAAMLRAAQSDLQALGTGTEDPLPQAPDAVAGQKLTSEAGQEARADMPASPARMNAAASGGKAAAHSEASPEAHCRPLVNPPCSSQHSPSMAGISGRQHVPFTASSGNPLPPSVTPPSPANGHSTPNATRSPTAALLDAEYTPEAKQQGADHPLVFPGLPASQASGVDRQPASVPLSASAASPINTARSADRQPAKPVASPASAQGSGLQAASQPVCTEGCRSFSALKPDADPPLSPAAISQETPTAVVSASSRQQAPAEMTQGTRQQQRTDVVSVGGSKLCVPGDFELADAKQYLQNGSNLFPAADAEAKNVSLASSMRGAQLSGGGQQQGSPKLQTLSSVASVVSSLEGDAGSEVFPQTGLGQERSAVGGDQAAEGSVNAAPASSQQKCPKRKGKGKKRGRNAGQLHQPQPSAATLPAVEAFNPDVTPLTNQRQIADDSDVIQRQPLAPASQAQESQATFLLATADIDLALPPDGQQPNLPTPTQAAGIPAAADGELVASNALESHLHAQGTPSNNKPVRHSTAKRVLPANPASEHAVNANDLPVRAGQPANKPVTAKAGEQAASGQNSAVAQSRALHSSSAGTGQNKASSASQSKGKIGTSGPAVPHSHGGSDAHAAQQAVTQRESTRRAEADEAVGTEGTATVKRRTVPILDPGPVKPAHHQRQQQQLKSQSASGLSGRGKAQQGVGLQHTAAESLETSQAQRRSGRSTAAASASGRGTFMSEATDHENPFAALGQDQPKKATAGAFSRRTSRLALGNSDDEDTADWLGFSDEEEANAAHGSLQQSPHQTGLLSRARAYDTGGSRNDTGDSRNDTGDSCNDWVPIGKRGKASKQILPPPNMQLPRGNKPSLPAKPFLPAKPSLPAKPQPKGRRPKAQESQLQESEPLATLGPLPVPSSAGEMRQIGKRDSLDTFLHGAKVQYEKQGRQITGLDQLIDQVLKDDYICPTTLETYVDPVMAADGHVYERAVLTDWFERGHLTSPNTNLPLENLNMTHQPEVLQEIRALLGRMSLRALQHFSAEYDVDHLNFGSD